MIPESDCSPDAVAGGSPPRRVLVVDDDMDFADGLAEMLKEIGFETAIARTAVQAETVCGEFQPGVALLDIRFGGISGVDLIPILKQIKPDLACVMITAHADMETAIAALRRGAKDYLRKPLHNEELRHVLNNCFQALDRIREMEA